MDGNDQRGTCHFAFEFLCRKFALKARFIQALYKELANIFFLNTEKELFFLNIEDLCICSLKSSLCKELQHNFHG